VNITLADFQIKAISSLLEAMEKDKREIVLKSCTGSGKTIILTHFMDEYCKEHAKTVFIWLTPGKGNIEEQSKEKMDLYIHGSQTKLLADVMTSGFEENDACFINWEKLTKKGNNALKDSEHTNFLEHIEKALNNGISFNVIVDESHQNDTIKANDIINYFHADKIIRCSATPKGYTDAELIEIPDEDVIAEGLIKKVLIINEDFAQNISVENQIDYLLDKALAKQRELHAALLFRNVEVNPLIVVQIPNKSEVLQDGIERWFEKKGITYENGQLAVWLSDKKQNLEDIEEATATPIAVIIKQAVATGWDCPRAHILVKLRDNMSETFEIQTIGRIRRMPEAKHYEDDLLDSCYLYTLDEKFTEGVKMYLGKGALDAVKLYMKPQYKKISLTSEQKSGLAVTNDATLALSSIAEYFTKIYKTDSDLGINKKLLEAHDYIFDVDIIDFTKSGKVSTLEKKKIDALNDINIRVKLNTHTHGREYHHTVGEIALKMGLEYSQMNTIIRKLFDNNLRCNKKILALDTRDVYAFVLNNADRLKEDIQHAMALITAQKQLPVPAITTVKFTFPQECLFTYDGTAKTQTVVKKNVYEGYLSSAEIRSASEKKFEKFCESCDSVQWVYKNGDKGPEYFSVVYMDSFGKQKSFYPDYIISRHGELWIIETKGGFNRTGKSEDIDIFSPRKFEVLKAYLLKYGLHGGFVREDKQSLELCICMDNYNDDIKSGHWKLLSDVL
jgi:type III restriction enzyme